MAFYLPEKGYSVVRALSPKDMLTAENIINAMLQRFFDADVNIENYHNLPEELHKQFITEKSHRVFSAADASLFISTESIRELSEYLGRSRVSCVVLGKNDFEFRPQVYFRIVRPNKPSDIGPVHRDSWYDEAYNLPESEFPYLKAWIAIRNKAGINGMKVVAGSHLNDLDIIPRFLSDTNSSRPYFEAHADVEFEIPEVKNGDCLIFPHKLLHGGILNADERCRVSIEIAWCR